MRAPLDDRRRRVAPRRVPGGALCGFDTYYGTMVSIREATSADARTIASLHEASIRGLGPEAYDDRQVEAWATGKDPEFYPVDEPDARIVVAEVDGDVVGFGHLDVAEREVRSIYVHPAYARRGVGVAILSALESAARDRGLSSLSLLAALNAVAFYERAGWQAVGERTHAPGPDTTELTRVRMRKRLA